MGCGAPVAGLRAAAMAVTSGAADYVLIPARGRLFWRARARHHHQRCRFHPRGGAIARDFYMPFGFTAPPQWYALMARRHMHEFGTTHEQLVRWHWPWRKHANLNPAVLMHSKPLTMADYLASMMIADPANRSTAVWKPMAVRPLLSPAWIARATSSRSRFM